MANFLYSGTEAPDINTVWTDKETYPNAYMYKKDSAIRLILLGSKLYATNAGGQCLVNKNTLGQVFSIYELGNAEWILTDATQATFVPFWCSTDIYYSNSVEDVGGTLYLAASEPVPIVPTPPSAQTAFCIGKAFGRLIRDSISAQST